MANENILLNDVELNYTKVATPFTNTFGTSLWETQIRVPASRKGELEAAGLKVKEDGEFVTANLRRKATKRDGTANSAPRVVDGNKAPMSEDAVRSIGNGSRGNVIIYVFDYEFGGQSGRTHSLTAIQVTDLVAYTGGADSVDFDVVDAASGEASPF